VGDASTDGHRIAAIVVAAGALLGAARSRCRCRRVSAAISRKRTSALSGTRREGALRRWKPAVAVYHSTLNGTDLVLRITKGGTMLGSLPIGRQAVQVVDVDNQLYISASADFWKAHGSTAAGTHAKGWTRADATDLALDPGSC